MRIDDPIPPKGDMFLTIKPLPEFNIPSGLRMQFLGDGKDPKTSLVVFQGTITAEVPQKTTLKWMALGNIKRLPTFWDHLLAV
jgi:hypothetical protein